MDVYDGPLRLDVALQRVDQDRAQALANDPVRLAGVVNQVSSDLQSAVVRLVWTTAGLAVVGAALTSLVITRRRKEPLIAAGITTVLLLGTGGLGAATWRPEALAQPTYSGLLANATSLIGSAEDIVTRFDAYRASLEDIVGNVGSLYATLSSLPAPTGDGETVVLLHVSDLHLNPSGFDLVRQVVDQFAVDGVLDTGDITDWGSGPENRLITSVGRLDVPYVFIRGNHDSAVTAGLMAAQPNVTVLDVSAVTVAGIEIAGVPDPRFTPDKSTGDDDAGDDVLEDSGAELADFVEGLPEPPAITMVHDPKQAAPWTASSTWSSPGTPTTGRCPSSTRDAADGPGLHRGAGLRALQGEYPEPLTCTVLYLDAETGRLQAYDEITLGGLGETEVTIQRRTLAAEPGDAAPADDSSPRTARPRQPIPRRRIPRPWRAPHPRTERPPPRRSDSTHLRSGHVLDVDGRAHRRPTPRRRPPAAALRLLLHRERGQLLDQFVLGHPHRGRRGGRDLQHHPHVRRRPGRARLAERRRDQRLVRRGESVVAGPLELECSSVTGDSVELTASLG
ncbi:metallophosphoesterase family protein [Blastococcus brunescens]|uniref:Metallophosphoesterase n=1 Tax=Blastococcus brunescens TaxID=1564165 RepID=A0ABZ1B059_9ACTN|nr:metallophosphoesterase [Blastococcus sp. BMG 8361]WRL63288.1 metallophosphoesterase [Blastococcus sp. BMG 8361]